MYGKRINLALRVSLSLILIGFLTIALSSNVHSAVIYRAVWDSNWAQLRVVGQSWKPGDSVTVSNPVNGNVIGTATVDSLGNWRLVVNNPATVPCDVWAQSATSFAEKVVANGPIVCQSPPSVKVFAFNNLGMHCYDSDYSVFSILPPFNTVNAQVVKVGAGATLPAILDNSQASVYFRGVADPSGSFNTTSRGKTNFWDHVVELFGVALPMNVGLTGVKMPGRGNVAQLFDPSAFDPATKWFTAEGIPITAWDNQGRKNYYPLMNIQPFDLSSPVIPAKTSVVLPVSDEMHCSTCHGNGGTAADLATSQKYGIAYWSTDPRPKIQYRENILILHGAIRSPDLMSQKPVLCAQCHYSPALDLAGTGPTGDQIGKPMLSYAIHGRHGKTRDNAVPSPGNPAIIPGNTLTTCYYCHPGSTTKCLRGAMGSAGIRCTDCHGGLLSVGGEYSNRTPWVDEPKCQSCHTGDALNHLGGNIRSRIAYNQADPAATPIIATNKRFAEEAGKLYRNSVGHGGVACEACHGSTHAEWPVSDVGDNDNITARQLQGHRGPIIECKTCHGEGQALTMNGPHGLHNVNNGDWNRYHRIFFEQDVTKCQACHGVALEGTVLSRAAANRTLVSDDGGTKFIARGTMISCTLCHENPLGGN
jgi:hypothetical protein